MAVKDRTPSEELMHAVLARWVAERGISVNCMREAKNFCKSAGVSDSDAVNLMRDVLPRAIAHMTGACFVEMRWQNEAGAPAIITEHCAIKL